MEWITVSHMFGKKNGGTHDMHLRQMLDALSAVIDDNDALFISLIQSIPLNIYAKNREGKFIFANSCYCKNTGKRLEEILGTDDFDVHPRELADKYRADDQRIISSGKTEVIEESWQSIGGEKGYIQVIKSPLFGIADREQAMGTIGVFWDITDRKRAELSLAEERYLLRTLIDNLPNYIYIKDRECRFLLGNRAVAELMGAASVDALVGKSDFDYYPAAKAEQFYHDDRQVIFDEIDLVDKEEEIIDHMGQKSWASTSKFPLRNLDGEVTGLVGIGRDITSLKKAEEERRKLEAQLLHSQKMETVGTLAAGIAHDFNNILSIINGYTELLLLGTFAEEKRKDILTKIHQAGQSAAGLVSQLTAFSSKQVIQPRTVNLNSVLRNISQMLQRIIGEKISIELDLAANLWDVKIDPIQVEQIVVNLAANARDAMPDGGKLSIETKNFASHEVAVLSLNQPLEPCEHVRLAISDNGCGIPKDVQRRVFEPFFTTKEMHKGTGLGLATVFGIVQQNTGGITLESEPGAGTRIAIFLPRTLEPSQESYTAGRKTILPPGTGHVLVVEDDDEVREYVLTLLVELGFTVHGISTGREAMNYLATSKDRVDMLVTDVVMPGINGKELADQMSAVYPDIKVFFMSGYTNDTIGDYDLARADRAFIQKPFSAELLAAKIRQVLSS